jgi:hypothetical protein
MPITAAPATGAVARYSFRRSVLESERTYSLYPDRLVVEENGVPIQSHELDRVRGVHLKFDRSKQRAYFQCLVDTDAGRVSLRHVHWGVIAAFEDRRETYTPFVRALLAQLANRPGVQFRAGSLLTFVSAIVGLPVMLLLGGLSAVMGLWPGALLAALLVFMCVSVLRRSRPRGFDPLQPPEAFLPL